MILKFPPFIHGFCVEPPRGARRHAPPHPRPTHYEPFASPLWLRPYSCTLRHTPPWALLAPGHFRVISRTLPEESHLLPRAVQSASSWPLWRSASAVVVLPISVVDLAELTWEYRHRSGLLFRRKTAAERPVDALPPVRAKQIIDDTVSIRGGVVVL